MLCNVRNGLSLLTAKINVFMKTSQGRIVISVWLRNRFISAGLESVLSHTEKIIYSIALQTIFHEYKNRKINIR